MTAATSLAERFAALGSEQRVRLMRRLVEAGDIDSIPAVVPPRDGEGPVRLSPAQRDLWVYESLYPGTFALNLCCAYHFTEPVNPAWLEAALTALQRSHDILRARISGDTADLRVDFPPMPDFRLTRTDLRGTTTTLAEVFDEFRRAPFDLRRDRLIRGRFVTVDEHRSTLMLALHHIIGDWWSFDVLHSEFVDAYRSVRDGSTPPTERPRIQYADFASWQHELDAAGVFDARLAFWRRYLADPPGPLTPRGPALSGGDEGPAQVPFLIEAGTARRIREVARDHGTTVYGVLMAAFAAYSRRLTDAADMVIGTPSANRAAQGLERVIGYVMNVVPTRWRIADDDTFADLLARFAAEFPRLMANSDVPVGRIVTHVAPARAAGRSPLFQWVFMYLPRQRGEARLREFTEPERIHTGGEHDLVGIVQETDTGMAGTLEVNTGRYPRDVVRHWAECFPALLDRLVAAPDLPVSSHDLMPETTRQRLLGSPADPLPPLSLPDLVDRQARRTPDATALESPDLILSYAQLAERSRRLAGRLAALGAGPGRIVALALGRTPSMAVAALATQRTGAAFLPIDPDQPADRLRHMLFDAAPVLVVTEGATTPSNVDIPVLALNDAAYAAEPLPVRPTTAAEAAYVIYTSGSTGRPKGVVVTHAGLAALTAGLVSRLDLRAGDRILQRGAPAFDIYIAEMCMAFGSAGVLVVPPPGPLVGDELAEALRTHRIDALLVTPTVLASVAPAEGPSPRSIAVGAEVCPAELPAAWHAAGRRFVNAYGPTETTVAVTVSDHLTGDGGTPPVGRPIAGTNVRVLDSRLLPVPVGVCGELYVAGDCLARGYLNQPGLTAERFVADPHGRPGTRMYRTGDIARWRADGQLDFVGRIDDQLNVRGLRVEPGEIATVLGEHPAVAHAVVVPRDQRLVAYVVPPPGRAVTPDDIVAYASGRLPLSMVPANVVVLDALPLTATGKLDRSSLPAPRTAGAAPASDSPREAALSELFAEVLGRDPVGRDDGFFDLGGDSIMAIQLVARARKAGLAFTPTDVLTAQTPARLALVARDKDASAIADEGVGRFRPTPVMCWWRDEGGELDRLTLSAVIRTPIGTNTARVERAVAALVRRHGALRIRLVISDDGGWELVVPPPVEPPAEHQPSSPPAQHVHESRPMAAFARVAVTLPDEMEHAALEAAAATRLDPTRGEMVRAVWFDPGENHEGRLLLVVHHLAVDAVSLRILGEDLRVLLGGSSVTEVAPGTSFRSWSLLLHAEATRPERETAEPARWGRLLGGPDARLVPTRTMRGDRSAVSFRVPFEIADAVVTRLPAAFRCGPDTVMLTALVAAAARWRGTGSALLVTLEGHGREALTEGVDVSETVGWFTAQYPVRIDAGGDFWSSRAADALMAVREQLRSAPSHGLGWGLLRYLNADTAAALARLPVPDVRFNYLGRFRDADGHLLGANEDGLPLAHPLEIDVIAEDHDTETRLVAEWTYPAGTFTTDEVRDLAALWVSALQRLSTEAHSGASSAADFPLANLTGDQLDALESDL